MDSLYEKLASIAGDIFTLYPGLTAPGFEIQVVTDKGPILEMVINCNPGQAIMSFSKLEHLYCLPNASCYSQIETAISQLCQ